MMDPPSKRMRKHSMSPRNTPQSETLKEIINPKKHKGFFVECGALDGERSSNTNFLEDQYKWDGLLIEADPSYYTQILGKNRKSWSINACLSPYPYTSFMSFAEQANGLGHLSIDGIKGKPSGTVYKVPCFTLDSLLAALNKRTIDFFSLDVEGAELLVLKSIPFDRVEIKTLTVEYSHVIGGKRALTEFMKKRGMQLYKQIDEEGKGFYAKDLFFVKN